MTLKSFVKECHSKQVFKMLSIYIVSSWILLQVLSVISDPLGLPEKSVTYLIIALLVGFPIYIYYVWKFRLLKYEIQQTLDPTTPYNKSAFQKMYFSSLFMISIVTGVAITFIIQNNFGGGLTLEELQGGNKIAVLEFENLTGNDDLKEVGKIAANGIVNDITRQELGDVISPRLVNDYTNVLKSEAGVVDLKNLLNIYFKPRKVIDGVFYEENGELILQCSIKDGSMDKTLISFETITCNPKEPLACIKDLNQNILGYLSTEARQNESGYIEIDGKLKSYFEESPPKYEALKFNQIAEDNFGNDSIMLEYLNKAIEADSNYMNPKTHKLAYYYNRGEIKVLDSLLKQIQYSTNLSKRQKNILLFYENVVKGRNDRAYAAHQSEYEVASKELATNMSNMTIALQFVNRPEDIDAKFDEVPMDDMILENCPRCVFRYYLKGLADVELGNYDEVISMLSEKSKLIDGLYLKRPLLMAYVRSNKLSDLEIYFNNLELTTSIGELSELYLFAGFQMLNSSLTEEANKYFNKIITATSDDISKETNALAYYYKSDYSNALQLLENLHNNDPSNSTYLVSLAISYFNENKFEIAKSTIDKLDNLRGDYQYGEIDYNWAKYYSAIGDRDKAMDNLRRSVAQGFNYTHSTYQNDPHFKTLKNLPEFKSQILNYWKNNSL